MAVGIADGVGGWGDSGINSALFATALMYYGARLSEQTVAGEPDVAESESESPGSKELPPKECLRSAYESVLLDKLIEAGELF